MIIRYLFFLLLFSLFLTSCKKFTQDEGVPSFIHIEKITLNSGVGQGTDSAYITDAWIYIDGEFHGAYELPATFPILRTGITNLTIKPGVIINGISGTRSINPFFEPINITSNLVADSTVNYSFQTTYTSNAKFPWNSIGQEDFEQGGVSLDSLSGSTSTIYKSKVDIYEGDYSGQVHLDTAHDYFLIASVSDFTIPADKSGLILELNCKNPASTVTVGIYFNLAGGTVVRSQYLFVNPGDHWKKLYVNFTSLLADYSTAESFKIFFESSLPSSSNEADVFLDNVKLVHY